MFNHKVSHLTVLDGSFFSITLRRNSLLPSVRGWNSPPGERSDPSCNREVGGNATHIPVTGYLQAISHSSLGSLPDRSVDMCLHYFPASTNMQELGIDNLQVLTFVPAVRGCFGRFSSMLRFPTLKGPSGPCQQTPHLIGYLVLVSAIIVRADQGGGSPPPVHWDVRL